MKIAIVGADMLWWNAMTEKLAKELIELILKSNNAELVSGACSGGGIDIWAEQIADKLGIKKAIFPAEFDKWPSYKKRNIQIAEACDILFDIEPMHRKWSGGMWTLNYAKSLGKQVVKIEIDSQAVVK